MAVRTQVPVAIALDTSGNLVRFSRNSPGTTTIVTPSGTPLAATETMVGIDYRPATGQLYGLAVSSTNNSASLYLIEPQSGLRTAVGVQGSINFVNAGGVVVSLPPAADGYGMS